MKSQDILVLLRSFLWRRRSWIISDMAHSLGLSTSEVHASIKMLSSVSLMDNVTRKPNRTEMKKFILNSYRYLFPVEYGQIATGLPIGVDGPILSHDFPKSQEIVVWPCLDGGSRGLVLKPIHHKIPSIAQKDAEWYALISLLDTLRIGKTRERSLAMDFLNDFFDGKKVIA